MEVESEPAFGSVRSNDWIEVSPVANGGSTSCLSASLPYFTIGTVL